MDGLEEARGDEDERSRVAHNTGATRATAGCHYVTIRLHGVELSLEPSFCSPLLHPLRLSFSSPPISIAVGNGHLV